MLSFLHVAKISTSREASGPGERTVVHFQGCSLGCSGCFNKKQWPTEQTDESRYYTARALVDVLKQRGKNVTFSGGEPFQQFDAFRDLLIAMKHLCQPLTILVFTGYTLDEIKAVDCTPLDYIDAMVTGRYEKDKAVSEGLLSSKNQEMHALTSRIPMSELTTVRRTIDVRIGKDGTLHATGFPTNKLRRELRNI